MNVKKIGAEAAILGALAVGGLSVGSGIANADQPLPDSPGVTWKLDRPHPHWDNWGGKGDDGGDWDGWRGGPQYYGPCVWVPPAVSMWVPPAVC